MYVFGVSSFAGVSGKLDGPSMQTAMAMNANCKSVLAKVLALLLRTTGRVLSGQEHQRIE
jgi:hypothetical protein